VDGEPSLEGGSLFRHLNRPQAKTSALPLLPPVYPPEELPSWATLKLLYEPGNRYHYSIGICYFEFIKPIAATTNIMPAKKDKIARRRKIS